MLLEGYLTLKYKNLMKHRKNGETALSPGIPNIRGIPCIPDIPGNPGILGLSWSVLVCPGMLWSSLVCPRCVSVSAGLYLFVPDCPSHMSGS